MGIDLERWRRHVLGAAGDGLSSDDLAEVLSAAIARVVPHDGLALRATDPVSGLTSFGFWHRVPLSFEVAQDALAAFGFGSELRLPLRPDRGLLSLLRAPDQPPFSDDDRRALAAFEEPLIALVGRFVTAVPLTPPRRFLPPGVITVGPDLVQRGISAHAWAWGVQVFGDQLSADTVTAGVRDVSRAASTGDRKPMLCLPAAYAGRWVTVQAEVMTEEGEVAIVIGVGGPPALLPSISGWFGITPRQQAVVELLCGGSAPKQIAHLLDVSIHTVNDHLKAAYRKVGVHSSEELIAALT